MESKRVFFVAQLNSPALVVFNVRETYGILIQTLHGISKDWGACFLLFLKVVCLGRPTKAYEGNWGYYITPIDGVITIP